MILAADTVGDVAQVFRDFGGMTAIVGAAVVYLRLFVKNAVNDAKSQIIAQIDADKADEKTVEMQFDTHSREIADIRRRLDGHDARWQSLQQQRGKP